MKRILIVVLLSSIIFTYGCKACQQAVKGCKSATIGVDREVTLYSASGVPIKSWVGRINIEDAGGSIRFIVGGKVITMSGTYLVEEK